MFQQSFKLYSDAEEFMNLAKETNLCLSKGEVIYEEEVIE